MFFYDPFVQYRKYLFFVCIRVNFEFNFLILINFDESGFRCKLISNRISYLLLSLTYTVYLRKRININKYLDISCPHTHKSLCIAIPIAEFRVLILITTIYKQILIPAEDFYGLACLLDLEGTKVFQAHFFDYFCIAFFFCKHSTRALSLIFSRAKQKKSKYK